MEIDTSAGLGYDNPAIQDLKKCVFGLEGEDAQEGVRGSLAEHISRVMAEIMRRNDEEKLTEDAASYVEEISKYVKDLYPPERNGQKRETIILEENARKWMKFVEAELSAREKPSVIECPIPIEDTIANPTTTRLLELAGMSIGGETEVMLLGTRMRELASRLGKDAKMLRFWGKILTTGTEDYYIAEALLPSLPQDEAPRNAKEAEEIFTAPEVRGRPGGNLYTYFVIQDITTNSWRELPQVCPQLLAASRSCKRLFSGHLDRSMSHGVSGQWLPFEGTEEEYLRCVIARISSSSILGVEGEWTAAPEDEEAVNSLTKLIHGDAIRAEGFELPPPQEMSSKDKWAHARPYLLRSGRTEHPGGLPEPKEGEESAMEALSAKLEQLLADDPTVERFTSIVADTRIQVPGVPEKPLAEDEGGEEGMVDPMDSWRIRMVGDAMSYATGEGSKSPAVVVVESMRWPGAAAFAQQSSGIVSNIYIGYGLKKDQPSLLPVEGPSDVIVEASDIEEQREPFPADGDDEVAVDDGEVEEE